MHLRLPHERAGARVDRVDHVVAAGVDQRRAPNRQVAIGAAGDAFGEVALVLPDELAGLRVERLDVVAAVRHVHHAAVDERRCFLRARRPARASKPA